MGHHLLCLLMKEKKHKKKHKENYKNYTLIGNIQMDLVKVIFILRLK